MGMLCSRKALNGFFCATNITNLPKTIKNFDSGKNMSLFKFRLLEIVHYLCVQPKLIQLKAARTRPLLFKFLENTSPHFNFQWYMIS